VCLNDTVFGLHSVFRFPNSNVPFNIMIFLKPRDIILINPSRDHSISIVLLTPEPIEYQIDARRRVYLIETWGARKNS